MKFLITAIALCLCAIVSVSPKDKGDDTLEFYLEKSELVASGTIVSVSVGTMSEIGVIDYQCKFKIETVNKGDDKLDGETIDVSIVRFELDEADKSPLVKKESKCILFLKKRKEGNVPPWTTADFWFGVQPPSPWMSKSLKRLGNGK